MEFRRGFTLVEVLVVIAIVLVLGGIAFVLFSPSQEGARQASCASQMKQLYQVFSIYASDNDAESIYPELHGLAYYEDPGYLELVTKNKQIMWCPSAPISFRRGLTPSYAGDIYGSAVNSDGTVSELRKRMIAKEASQGSTLNILECTAHDEFFFAPGEHDIDNTVASPFKQYLRVDGSTWKGRVRVTRDFPISGQ